MPIEVDISAFDYPDFISFLFDRQIPVGDDDRSELRWYRDIQITFGNRLIVLQHFTRLFTEFTRIANTYTLPQINAGIWLLLGSDAPIEILLLDTCLPQQKRCACIRAMYHVYADVVALSTVELMENCFDMWWDVLGHDFWATVGGEWGDYRHLNEDRRVVLDVMFETLSRILDIHDVRCQQYALHGLGHLHHPNAKDRIQQYLDAHVSDLTPTSIAWIRQCQDGAVM